MLQQVNLLNSGFIWQGSAMSLPFWSIENVYKNAVYKGYLLEPVFHMKICQYDHFNNASNEYIWVHSRH